MTLLFEARDPETLARPEDRRYLLPGCELAIALAPDGGDIADCPVCSQSHNPAELRRG